MIQESTLDKNRWLRLLICLVLSIGVHASLAPLDWQEPLVVPRQVRSLDVFLVEAPREPEPLPPSPPPQPVSPRKETPSGRVAPEMPVPAAPAVVEPAPDQNAIHLTREPYPAAAEGEAHTDADQPRTDESPGEGSIPGAAASPVSGSGDAGAEPPLIKATPRYESNPLPHYPHLAKQNRWEGTVRLRARLTAAGEIEELALERSSGHEVLDQAALDGVRFWRFIPATRGGVPVPSEVSIPVAFRLTE